jgi:hypothetical protein
VRSAVLLSAGMIGLLVAGVPWIAGMLPPLGSRGEGWTLAQIAGCIDVIGVLEGFRGQSIDFGAALRRSAVFSGVYAGLTVAILAAIFHRFRRITGRC